MVTQQRLTSAFIELADTLVADFGVIDFLHTLADLAVELLDTDAVGLMLADQRGELQLIAASTEESEMLELFELQSDEGPCLDCFAEGHPVVNVDPQDAMRRWPAFYAVVRAAGFESVHAVPLRLRNQVIGAMNLFVAQQATLGEDDIALVQALADMATIGLLQERAVREHQVLAGQLQGALNSRIVVEQAKGMVAERRGVDMGEAFAMLRAYARGNGSTLTDVAADVIGGSLDGATLMQG
jgi:GAF domain-containing protein